MAYATVLFFSAILIFLFLVVGGLIGWTANDFLYAFMNSRQNLPLHPEMYDDEGIVINEELLSVRFIDEEEEEEDDYY